MRMLQNPIPAAAEAVRQNHSCIAAVPAESCSLIVLVVQDKQNSCTALSWYVLEPAEWHSCLAVEVAAGLAGQYSLATRRFPTGLA